MDHPTTPSRADRAARFHRLHEQGTFVLPNAWDAASAAVIAAAGAGAVATTSSGISWAHGVPDGESLSREEMVAVIAQVVRAVNVPVTADIEAGYGSSLADVATTIRDVCDAGAVGANLEDRPGPDGQVLWPIEQQCERLAAARAAADDGGADFILNARTDVFLAGVGDPSDREDMVLERAEAYARAGAACLFVPGLLDLDAIGRLVRGSPLPLNVLLAPGRGPTIAQLTEAGARRVSVGHTIAAAAYGTVRRATSELMAGEDTALRDGISHPEMQQLMVEPASRS
jgi:2-methylisocitrate lyase-like PEP mutase family enzyme